MFYPWAKRLCNASNDEMLRQAFDWRRRIGVSIGKERGISHREKYLFFL
jgi:hypothetical protein